MVLQVKIQILIFKNTPFWNKRNYVVAAHVTTTRMFLFKLKQKTYSIKKRYMYCTCKILSGMNSVWHQQTTLWVLTFNLEDKFCENLNLACTI